jgi:hypothetical protein
LICDLPFYKRCLMNLSLQSAAEHHRKSMVIPLTTDPMWNKVTFLLDVDAASIGPVSQSNKILDKRHDNPITQYLAAGLATVVQDAVRGKVLQFPANNNSRFVVENQGNGRGLDGGAGNFTLDFWVKGKVPTGGESIVASADAPFTYMAFKDGAADQGGRCEWYIGLDGSWRSLMTPTIIYDAAGTTWHHIAHVYDRTNNQIRLYVDGVLSATINNYLNQRYINIPSLTIGRYNDYVKSRSIHKLRLTNAVRFTSSFNPNTLAY